MKNLVSDKWIPITRKSGKQDVIAPWQLTETDDPIVSLNSPRPDFDGALMQFLIGLLQTTITPDDMDQWAEWLENPPETEWIKNKLVSVAHAFSLYGSSFSFMQDADAFEVKSPNSISDLLIDAPGGNTLKENRDHFVKRSSVEKTCPACTAMALFTLQTNAPSGGQGHRTSLRGGGPLTTLIALDPQDSGLPDTLWVSLWINVIDKDFAKSMLGNWDKTKDINIFPWLAPTRTSESKTGLGTFPQDAHPFQMYWAMPRRIRILWNRQDAGACDLCGCPSDELVSQYETKNYGVNYSGEWQHPLSPHSQNNEGELLPRHAQPGGLSYRHWLGLIENSDASIPALVVKRYQSLLANYTADEREQFRLHVFGYDMDNMKARCWYESTFPLFAIDEKMRASFSEDVQILTATATETAGFVRSCVKDAWFKRPKDARGDTSFLIEAFFQHTEHTFYLTLRQLLESIKETGDITPVFNQWHKTLQSAAHELFDYWANNGDFSQIDPRRVAQAKTKLIKLLNSKKIKTLLLIPNRREKAA